MVKIKVMELSKMKPKIMLLRKFKTNYENLGLRIAFIFN